MKRKLMSIASLVLSLSMLLGSAAVIPAGAEEPTLTDVAHGKYAWSSHYYIWDTDIRYPSLAVDGSYETPFFLTNAGGDAYTDIPAFWAVDLGARYTINKIQFHIVGGDRRAEEGMNFKIQVSNDMTFPDSDTVDVTDYYTESLVGQTTVVEPDNLDQKYRYVRFIKKETGPAKDLNLHEVYVYTEDEPQQGSVALPMTYYASNSNEHIDPVAGSTRENIMDGSLATGWWGQAETAFMTVDLGEDYDQYDLDGVYLKAINVDTRWELPQKTPAEFKIELSNDPDFATSVTVMDNAATNPNRFTEPDKEGIPLVNHVDFSRGMLKYTRDAEGNVVTERIPFESAIGSYRYVRVQGYGYGDGDGAWAPLGIFELQVFGTKKAPTTLTNVAMGKYAWTADYPSWGWAPSYAVDGNQNYPNWDDFFLTNSSEMIQFWAVDLGQPYTINKIQFYVPGGRPEEEGMNFKIQVSNDMTFTDSTTRDVTDYYRTSLIDKTTVVDVNLLDKYRYVRFVKENPGTALNLHEVYVLSEDAPQTPSRALPMTWVGNSDGGTADYPYMYDSNLATGWISNNETCYITYDLGEDYARYTLDGLFVKTTDQANTLRAPAKYKVELSNDPAFPAGQSVTLLDNTTDSDAVPLASYVDFSKGALKYSLSEDQVVTERIPFETPITSYRYLRFSGYDGADTGGTSGWKPPAVQELRLFGTDSQETVPELSLEFFNNQSDMTPIETVPAGGSIAMRVNAVNLTNENSRNFVVYAAEYDAADSLQSVQMFQVPVQYYSSKSQLFDVTVKEGNKYRFFFWDADTLQPLSEVTSMQ